MGTHRKSQTVRCTHFTWNLFKRGEVYYADGRSNIPSAGKHSLNTKVIKEALQILHLLDQKKAIEYGLIEQDETNSKSKTNSSALTIPEGWTNYLNHCSRPKVMGGVSKTTSKRYRAVKNKHLIFCSHHGIISWSQCNKKKIELYGFWLNNKGYADRTVRFELRLLLTVMNWLIEEKYLDSGCRFKLNLAKPTGTDTYCYSLEQVTRMLELCLTSKLGKWLRPILITLATSGMRIGELISLKWKDIDFNSHTLRIVDDRYSHRKQLMGSTRTTKGKRSRTVPLNPALEKLLLEIKSNPDDYVFYGPKGGRLCSKTVLDIFKREVRDNLIDEFPVSDGEIGFEHGTIHSFRHYFVSQAFQQGATEAEIMEWVGHRQSETVHHYRHLRADDSQRRMQSITFIEGDDGSSSSV